METTLIPHRDQATPAWYCLQSLPKHEHIAAAHLRRLVGVAVFCPRVRFRRSTRQGIIWVTEAMFPGYLFARFEFSGMHRQVRYSPGVSAIVRFGERYPRIQDDAIARLRDCTGQAEVTELNHEPAQGDHVKIVNGVFVGLEAVVTQVLPAKQRIRVLMDFLGRKMEAEVEHSSVLSQVAHPLAV
ncbi:MAG: hypothetical protein JO069_19090 [Verrucomicrobia bacterium]|nr:hypothetical protein [Verrucomicrobiota bacterium]